MILSNIKSAQKDRGFTIVELLVVIVVIGILSAITIVSYTGVSNRAKTASAQSNANSVQQVAEAFNSDMGYYPSKISDFSAGTTTKLPESVKVVPASTAVDVTNGQSTVTWECVSTTTTCPDHPTGGRIKFFDFGTSAMSGTIIYVGNATSNGTYANPAS